jgi:Na+-driven multidrug efflux pump
LVEAEKHDETLHKPVTFGESVKTVLALTASPIFGSFFHPIYLIVNASVLGHANEPVQLAGIGLGSLTLGICVISIGSCFAMGSSTFISQAYGAKDLKMCVVYRNRQIFLNTILYVILAIPQIFIRHIYDLIG